MPKMHHALDVAMVMVLCSLLSAPIQAAEGPDEKAQCAAQLKKIHQAIQDYRKEHKAMPNWLSDLKPQFIKDANVFLCPVQRRTGQAQTYEGMVDPKLDTSYLYEFCNRVIPPNTWGGDKEITMRTWKSLQMALLGGKVPLLRCLNHGQVLNLSFDGEIWESELTWEQAFADVVDPTELSPRRLMARFQIGRATAAESGTAPSVEEPLRAKFPTRDPQATSNQIDLSRFYNVSLRESWHSDRPGNDLGELPAGLTQLDGTRFDVRGIIQVSGPQLAGANRSFPHQVSGIPVNLKLARLHFLHSTGFVETDGVVIGQYLMHYSDGQTETCPIVYGQNVRDWWYYPATPKEAEQSHIAWTGNNQAAKSWNPPGDSAVTLRLYKTTWQNPHPDTEITAIDFVSAEKNSSPFLVAVTAE
jgi:hypothetical protein